MDMETSEPVQPAEPLPEPPAERPRAAPVAPRPRRKFTLHFGPPFWTIASIISLLVNVVLIAVLISVGRQLFTLKNLVEKQLIAGLYDNFILMDQAHIRTTIPVNTNVPAKFDLPLKTNTTVTLTEDTTIVNATVARLQVGGAYNGLLITNAPANIVLPAGTRLPIALDLTVPVNQTIPVSLNVMVDIPLNQTDLHKPFVGLQETVRPYYNLMEQLPNSWSDVLCGKPDSMFCGILFP